MPSRRPNSLYGAAEAASSSKKGGEIVYVETDPDSDWSPGRVCQKSNPRDLSILLRQFSKHRPERKWSDQSLVITAQRIGL